MIDASSIKVVAAGADSIVDDSDSYQVIVSPDQLSKPVKTLFTQPLNQVQADKEASPLKINVDCSEDIKDRQSSIRSLYPDDATLINNIEINSRTIGQPLQSY